MFHEHQISIRMISEESCDTENWSNDAENSASQEIYYIKNIVI